MYKLNFVISLSSYRYLNRYSKSLNLSIQTIIKFLLAEQILVYINNSDIFEKKYRNCKHKEAIGTKDAYENDKPPKKYSIEVTEYIYDNIQKIREQYADKTNTVVNNLLHIGIYEKLSTFNSEFATAYKDITASTKQYAIPLSSEFSSKLQNISKITGIKINQLMSLIIGNYLIEHYVEYDNNIYMDFDTGKYFHDIW